jgi:hypothetical protein
VFRGNVYRAKTEMMKLREKAKLLEIETVLARRRMGHGSDGEASKAAERVGKVFGQSARSIYRGMKILKGIDQAAADGNTKLAERLTELVNARKTVKALALMEGGKKPKPGKAKKRDLPRTFLDHANTVYSECESACRKADAPVQLDYLERHIARCLKYVVDARARLASDGSPEEVPWQAFYAQLEEEGVSIVAVDRPTRLAAAEAERMIEKFNREGEPTDE